MSDSTMQAIVYNAYGGPEVTEVAEMPIPTPKAGEVQVRVAAGGLNPVDILQRLGNFKSITPYSFRVVAGNEFSGVVTVVGEGVTSFAVGDKVICRVAKDGLGALGEYAVMPASIVAKAPTSIPLVEAAGLPLAGLTAQQCLDEIDVKAGDRVLITGGAGGVGQFAIQLAKLRGAHVSTTASDAGKPFVQKAGADEIINYHTTKLVDLEPFDKVFDVAGGEEALINDVIPAVKKGGKIVSVAGVLTPGCLDNLLGWYMKPLINLYLWSKARGVTNAAYAHGVEYKYLFMRPDGPQLQKLAELVDAGKLKITIDGKFKMPDYAQAFERLASGKSKGKIVIEINGE